MTDLVELGFAEIHLGMLLHELREHVLLLLILAGGQAHLLLSLIVHHLLDQRTGFAVQVGELRGLRVDFSCGNRRVGGDESIPPRHLIDLLERDDDDVFVDGPQRVVGLDFGVELSIDDRRLVLQANFESLSGDANDYVTRFQGCDVFEWHAKLKSKFLLD